MLTTWQEVVILGLLLACMGWETWCYSKEKR